MADAQANSSATPGPECEVHRADAGERRRVLLGLALTVISGGLLLLAMTHELGVIGERIAIGDMDIAADRFLWLARGSCWRWSVSWRAWSSARAHSPSSANNVSRMLRRASCATTW